MVLAYTDVSAAAAATPTTIRRTPLTEMCTADIATPSEHKMPMRAARIKESTTQKALQQFEYF